MTMNLAYRSVGSLKDRDHVRGQDIRPARARSGKAAWNTGCHQGITFLKELSAPAGAIDDSPQPDVIRSLACYQFGDFTIDRGRFELRFKDQSVSLERKPLQLLILLASRAGSLVSRTEIIDTLWDREVFVDTDHGINTAIRKIRRVLKDDAVNSRFIQTVVGLGYRFVAQVHLVVPSPSFDLTESKAVPCSASLNPVVHQVGADTAPREQRQRTPLRSICARPVCVALRSLIRNLNRIHLRLKSR